MIENTKKPGSAVVRFLTMAVFLAIPSAIAWGQVKSNGGRLSDVRERFPGVQVHEAEDGVIAVFGRPTSVAITPEKAAATFLRDFGIALGVSADELELDWKVQLGSGKGTVYAYRQVISGLPVERSTVRVLVSPVAPHAVVYGAGRLVRPSGPFEPDGITGEVARMGLQLLLENADLTRWLDPELVVYAGEPETGMRDPVRAWKISANGERGSEPRAVTFFVNAATGRVLFARNEIYHGAPISGHVTGNATPGLGPDTPANAPQEIPLGSLFVRDLQSNQATTDVNGEFVLIGTGEATQISGALVGPSVEIRDTDHPPAFVVQDVTPPGPAHLLFNPTPAEFTTAHVNAFVHANETHDFFKHYQPDFDELDLPITTNVNLTLLSCNAFFTPVGLSINFVVAGGGCVNTAYSSVVNHEYGHFIVNQLRLAQGAFGEGYADSVAILMHDDPIIGRDFFAPGAPVRDIEQANEQYPCNNEVHVCGQVIAGTWWDIKENLKASLGESEGLELARQLFTDWSMITLGGRLRNSAHPGTAIEVLTADDDDGDLTNGTPNQVEICAAFEAHNLPCSNTVDCGSVRIRAACRRGTVSASVSTTPHTLLTIVIDGTQEQEVEASRFGRALARFPNAGSGEHEVCVAGCENACRTVTCD